MRYTFLDIIQLVLSSLDSNKVNSWSDTSESEQIGYTIRDTFNYMVSDREIPELKQLRTLVPYSELIRPTHFFYPVDCQSIEWVKYNKVLNNTDPINMEPVQYCLPSDFLDKTYYLNATDDWVQQVTEPSSNINYLIRNNKNPDYWTTFDDKTIVMDSFYNVVDDSLQESKVLVYGIFLPRFEMVDSYIVPIDDNQFQILINKVKTICFYEMKKEIHQIAADDVRKARVRNFNKRNKYETVNWNDYGRNSGGRGYTYKPLKGY